ncbi:hypothetical protein ACIBL3_06300 [Kribbella sp. NPDC050124]|uniref:hypothetical protein n=1 Tax=Kribbella sp. NPDC050124 TaxID=3364114 RepID=UPI003791BDA7
MTGWPVPDEVGEILRVLPEKWHAQFLDEYDGAGGEVLRLWRLRAVAYSSPRYDEALEAAREGRDEEFIPAEQVIPGWPDGR